MRVATYNVHGFVGTDGQRDVQRIAQVIRELDARVVGLQEVVFPSDAGLSEPQELVSLLPEFRMFSAPVLRGDGVRHGNVLLTSLPVRTSRVVSLDFGRFEQRRALDVSMDAEGHELRVLNTHLGLRPQERRFQVKRLLEMLQEESTSAITLLVGDFNEWFLAGRPLRWLEGHFGRCVSVPTFPSRFPLLALDRIWSFPRAAIEDFAAHRSEASRIASDHLPAVATVRIPPQ